MRLDYSFAIKPIKAQSIAEYIITRCFCSGKPVTAFKLCLLLYFIQLESYSSTGHPVFEDEIEFSRSGPKILSVYYEYNIWVSGILLKYNTILSHRIILIIDKVLDNLIDKPVYELYRYVDLYPNSPYCIAAKKHKSVSHFLRDVYGN